MRVTADTSILIHLAAIGRFYLLKELFGEIIIPDSVYNEVVVEGWGLTGSLEASEATREGFIKINKVMDKEKVKEICQKYKISTTNAEVVHLSIEVNAEVVLADEEEVREATQEAGIKVKGCLGLLLDSVKNKMVTPSQAIKDIDNLISSGYRIRNDIVKELKATLRRWSR
jgi:hypothetical protein